MSHNLAQYHARSPRYILQPQDNTLVRVAGPHQLPWEESTEIKNISLTGLAFTATPDLCPVVGEMIKIQFEVPGGSQMACYGLVTRLEKMGRSNMQVSVKFHRLDMSHRIILAQGLALRMKEQQLRHFRENRSPEWGITMKSVLFLALWVFLFHLMTGLNIKQWLFLLGIN